MRKISNETPNKNWKEDVLKEFGMTSENVRAIDILGGEFYEEISSDGTRTLCDKSGNEVLKNFDVGIIVSQIWIYVRKKKNLHAFSYKNGELQKKSIIIRDCDVKFTEDGKIQILSDSKVVRVLDEDLTEI